MDENRFLNPQFYKNRELSWLLFEERVLNEAKDRSNRLFERLKFLSITGTNLDEFFMIRVASIKKLYKNGKNEIDISGLSPFEQLELISKKTHEFTKAQYDVYNNLLAGELRKNGIDIVSDLNDLSEEEKLTADEYFAKNIYPILTPIVIDSSRPFPILRNNCLYVGGFILRKGKKKKEFAFVQVPPGIERIFSFSNMEKTVCILTEALIMRHFSEMFPVEEVFGVNTFRVIRNADLQFSDRDFEDPLQRIEEQVEKRDIGDAILLEISETADPKLVSHLMKELSLEESDVYYTDGPIDLRFLMEIYRLPNYSKFRNAEYVPVMPWEFDGQRSLFSQIAEHDLMLIHPFESFKPVIDFINEAADDPNVLTIKQTLYRVSGNSPIVHALVRAAENGKQVTVLVELKARFDEENNILWARTLESAGCNVIYGFAKIKTHCKLTLVVRKEGADIKRYVHLGTGNYNDSTARQYTDISFFTAKPEYGEDASNVFNMLSGYTEPAEWKKLSLAPKGLRDKFLELIEREAEHARCGRPSHIIAKINSLCDKEIISALYKASSDGVKIDLIVRGICCLRTGIPGVSENITVRSIVGNFLEHSRIFYFKNGGETEYFCSSADWMPRNMDKRIEILFPVERKRLREKLNHVLKLMLKDNQKAWIMDPDGLYSRHPDDDNLYSFQEGFALEEKNTKGSIN